MQLFYLQYASYAVSLIKGDNNCNSKTATADGKFSYDILLLKPFNITARPDWKTWVDYRGYAKAKGFEQFL